jgi:hypothetical protein
VNCRPDENILLTPERRQSIFMSTPSLREPAIEKKIAAIIQGIPEIVLHKMKTPPAESSFDYYIIQKWDNLSAIAKRCFGIP